MYEKLLAATHLTEKQAKVYVACIRHREAKIPDIAKMSGLKRTTVYGIIDELEKMGLITKTYKAKSVLIHPVNPERLLDIAEEKQHTLQGVVSDLDKLFTGAKAIPRVQFFEGLKGIKKIYADMLLCKEKEVFQVVNVRKHTDMLGKAFITEHIKKRVKEKIKVYDLHPKSGDIYTAERGLENKALLRYVRFLPAQVFTTSMIMLYDNKLAVISTQQENFGLLIESRELVASLKEIFHFLWNIGSVNPE